MSKKALNSNYESVGFLEHLDTRIESVYAQNKCIHQIFVEQVEKTPDAVAILFENQQLTYRELNTKANQLAHYLQAMGVIPEVMVGLCVERSIELVIGILGILKAGGAYVPLDPAYPQERLAFILEDTHLKVVLTKTQWLEILPVIPASVICLDAEWQKIGKQSQENPVCDVTSENLAYLIYTSGSTGKPKGVQMPHASVCNYLEAIAKIIPVNNKDIYLHIASFSFTASVRQLFLPLSQGATTVIATREQTRTPLSLFELIQNQEVTISDGVPSLWRYGLMALESLDPKYTKAISQSKLRLIIFGGELLPYQLIKKLRNLLKNNPRFFNILGQTESIGNGFYLIPEDCNIEEGYVPVGHPLKDIQQVYVLNSQLEPVKIGETGELHIAGSTLARGYLNRTQANAEKFITNPFNPQQKLFKTGDVARYSPDGNLEILGRIDFQVNIRGMRVELEEIEAVLKLHPSVRESVVSLREDIPGDQRLVAYIVPNNQALDLTKIRSFIEHKVPDYMVPNAFVLMEKLPVLPNGKLDRNNLPAPNISADIRKFVAPRNPQEELIANIWAEVLRLEKVGIYDNFLELGGHSLLASLVISRLREALAVELPVSVLFESPTVASLSEKIENLSQQNQPDRTLPILESIQRSVELPLSLIQQRFWILDQMEGANAAYNITRALSLVGSLNLTALQQAIQSIIQRHETLRTSFGIREGKPVQFIAETLPFTLVLEDLEPLPKVKRQAELERLITTEYTEPFNLSQAPLLRVKLIRLESDSHVLLVTMHHIISDAWSMGIFLKELSSLYVDSPLQDLPIQYADYAYWQRQWLQNDIINTQLNYWLKQLADAPPIIELLTDYPRSAVQTFRGSIQRFKLGNNLTNKLKKLSQKSGTSLFMTLQAAFVTFLYRYTGQEDIVIGSPITNRNRPALESLIGFFVNTLVLRTQLKNNPTFKDLLAQVRQVALDAYVHQDLPFDRLVEVLQPQRHLSHTPLFQVMFVLQNSPIEKLNLAGLDVTQIELDKPTAGATFDLTLSMQEIDSELRGAFEYNANLFDDDTIARMVEHFQILVEAIVNNPDERVGQIPLLTAAQQEQLLVEWNQTHTSYSHLCIHQLFEQQVERTPDAIAIQWENQQFTYQELNNRANQLANYLQKLGVGAETLVGICLERSPKIIIAMLGILKAGGAYLPLDPTYPSDRLTFMLEDAQVFLLLTEQQLSGKLTNVKQICLDRDWSVICQENQQNLNCYTTANNLAYIIYTSGSTGQPKGVMVTHQGVVRLAVNTDYVKLQPTDVIAQVSNTSFDAATFEIWGALLNGAKVAILNREIILSPRDFASSLQTEGITILFITTALFNKIVQEVPSAFRHLRYLLFGGEAVDTRRVRQLLAVDEPQKLLHVYGPTENTTFSTWYHIQQIKPKAETVPIGRSIANTQSYILDRYLQPVPIGVTGELYLGGTGLARGYLNRPDLTSERFISHPFVENERLYKTGDLARYLPDGNIQFLGRIDHQVKIRGFRIELGEIETVLSQHPQVQQVVVIVREDEPGNKYLTAYIVNENLTLTSNELRQFLKEQLPEYMIPSAFAIVKTLPLTPNGKVDRKALPKPETTNSELEATFVAPRTWLEEQLAEIWCTVLHCQQVGIYDNFFELGGHSLLLTSIISRIREKLSIEIPLRSLLAAPTIAELSQVITAIQLETENESASCMTFDILPPLVPQVRNTYVPLSFAQESIWYLQHLTPESCAYNSFVTLRFTGSLSANFLESSFNEIIRRHEILRTAFTIIDGQPVQIISPSLTISLEIIDLQNLPHTERISEAQRLAALEYDHHFDLASVPLIKTKLLQLTQEEYWLTINMHHIITDGWSLGLLLEELRIIYTAFANGLPSPLPELPVQYADFTLWQRQYFNEKVIEKQLAYWLEKLTNTSQISNGFSNIPPQVSNSISASVYSIVLSASLVASMETFSRSRKVTLFIIIMTALKILFFKYSGKKDILVSATVGNRNGVETEKMLGCFINEIILRSHLSSEETGLIFLEQVQETFIEAINNKEIACQTVIDTLKTKQPLNISASLTMLPPENWQDWMLDVGFVSIERDRNLWEEAVPLELFVSSPSANNPTIEIKVLYSTELFTHETIEFMFNYYQEILQKLVQDPTIQISEFEKDLIN
ncbi:amino acid adenylation domain-containing protein [Aerosakkonemataceae cyanobacterium BLCC-F154]|uniref:Amino acid adenylation domain-containing protein n=1 Tax=Floridaenema fluviatile BLCC-F154 TaxID=3153640 RepID=A0ABV4YJT8_9CYAN